MSRSIQLALAVTTCCALPAFARAGTVSESHDLELAVGENQTLSAADVKSYSEGVPGIVEVKLTPSGSHFVVVGQRPGNTTLLLLERDGSEVSWNIRVFARPAASVASELAELVGDQTGIRVKRIGSRFFIEGGVSTEADLNRIQHIAALYAGQVESLVVLGGVAADRKINIRIDFFFVQYDKTKTHRVGVDWPSRFGGGISSFAFDFLQRAFTSATAVVTQPLPALDLAASNGWAKVLKHATVITANGAEATFSSGGQQNFPIVGGLSNTIQSIKFGTEVRVLPRFDPTSREIAVAIDADVADLTEPVGATDIPGQNLSKLATNVALKLGQSVVLSGIRTSSEVQNTYGVPGLSEIPILGLLFGSESNRRQDLEGALFIVPSVLDTASPRAHELIDQAFAEYDRYSGNLSKVTPFRERPELR
ncbi:MAG TPA: pilus assembly protein N-terminal domain-containing protein [Polyangiales bacterium]|nr:pilus assembly protein N-terminal domain-containing protein [Polyangiales bacterium]